MKKNLSVLGAGSWGTALAYVLSNNGHNVKLWDAYPEILHQIQSTHKHKNLPDLSIDDNTFTFVYSLPEAFEDSDFIITVIPSQIYKHFWKSIKPYVKPHQILVNCSKGIDVENTKFIIDLLSEAIPEYNLHQYAVLSGPSYATEVIKKIPTAIVAASSSIETAKKVQHLFGNNWFRVYTNTDVMGVELAGAVKNVIAIASGISRGIGYGINTSAALITRGNAEIVRLGISLGANIETFFGLAGIGDLMLTALSDQSRNFSFGKLLGQGLSFDEAKNSIKTVIEGIDTVKSAKSLAKKQGVEMPIVDTVYKVLFEKLPPLEAVKELMNRDLKSESFIKKS